ncbi:TetR/AcrR family transcriptional regulator [Paenibacillus sp. P96]|uniref:TetR/AcrR family transcriptional regulator n=1 Tax=Paenibacillus zeirhizosphaerae TaxID=2987519 RepID=A0ABT9FVR7_9BACL|nr:TetR/AcrR family transcriptional regulator [Paenibacillus sp. P96]MDP4098827.1 TetR/AcrR family transcriptional regulator [Paenibacillus sp. P96]
MKKITSEEIIQAALSLFSEKGYEATSVDEIARQSGMVKASFYKYFKSKEELLQGTIAFVQEDMEKELEKVYLNFRLSPREKLTQFYIIALERVYQSKMHLLIFSVPLLGSTDERIAQAVDSLENSLSNRVLDLMSNLYGEEWSDYYYDIIFVIKSMLISYVRMNGVEFRASEHQMLADFVMSITDILMQGMTSPDHHHEIMWKPASEEQGIPRNQWQQVDSILQRMHDTIGKLNLQDADKHDYFSILEKLQAELAGTLNETAHVKALLLFLGQVAELRECCQKLKIVLNS